ncbi:hypothetical protein [Fuscibacter oryzae]|uniref:Uncharacterized protein n=1 Tax=Fuscibacter oryzae TaxID=2803939 RepID=A0A8J7SWL9_9RHOB|nr:hypothetical protein [Fuscibacter oryzae]MBL4929806.1 hypothetical protein [Fuscibacter oryzae]
MRPYLFPLLLAATPLHSETLSAEIGRAGLAPTEARLATLPAPSDEEKFALGGLRFLRAIEISFQIRWQNGMTDRTGMLPLLRLPVPDNPNPAPFDPTSVAEIFRQSETTLTGAHQVLETIPDTADFGLTVNLADLWFDVNANATRDPEEGLLDIAGPALLGWQWSQRDPATPAPVIRFDVADAAWLAAYAHGLQAISQVVLAYDPTEPVTRILATRSKLTEHGPLPPDMLFGSAGDGLDSFDMIALALATLNQQPDTARMVAARDNLLAAVDQNRMFWTRVAAETDNQAEWLPNARQTSALGLTLPPDTGAVWQAVLADGEELLKGDKLIPYWRSGPSAGINLAKIFIEPRPVDVPGWIQGWAAMPYYQAGETVSAENWSRFESIIGGDAMLMALWLN